MSSTDRVKPLVVFRKPKGCPAYPIPPTTVGILIIEYRAAGKRVAQSTGVRVAYKDWNSEKRKIRGTSRQVEANNDLLDTLVAHATDACRKLREAGQAARPGRARAIAQGVQVLDETLLESWKAWHLHQVARAKAGEIQPATAQLPLRRIRLLTAWLTANNRTANQRAKRGLGPRLRPLVTERMPHGQQPLVCQ